ncbi:sulfatase-like hydrolase/transferase [Allosphingosinicella sp.]|uniref:sulfatase-like hydrolase/transferase n=1 Tax=Allosphingosinicella sp. TaxID=2823234 RepID=UPI002FC10FF6
MSVGTWVERGRRVRGLRLDVGFIAFVGVAAVTLLVELVLVERKFAIFGGGFGQPRTIGDPLEIIAFCAGLLVSQLLLLYALFRLVRGLHGGSGALFLFNALFLIPAVLIGILATKYRLLSYFSDAIGFQVIRNLGGGSLVESFLYILSEAGLLAFGLAVAAFFYWVSLRLVRRHAPRDIRIAFPPALGWKRGLVVALAIPPLVLAVNAAGDARFALARFNAYALLSGGLHQLTDLDRDGYSLFSWRIDRHPLDGSRHPLALDIPSNGIDEDGLAGDFILEVASGPTSAPAFPADPRHVILLVLESVRGEVVGKRIDGRLVAPNITALAASGTWVKEAYSHVGFTSFSLKTLFTGELTPRDDRHSLFRDFKANGYRVGVLSAQAEDFGDIASTVGMRTGEVFIDAGVLRDERVFDFASDASLKLDGRVLLREFDRHFGKADTWSRPTFLYMNLQASHFPYHHRGMPQLIDGKPIPRGSIDAGHKEWVERTYWNAVAYDDRLIGELIARLKGMGVYDDSLIVILSDHGESLFDDGFLGHGHMINAQQTHIPLIFSEPGLDIAGPVGLDDVRGLILAALGASPVSRGIGGPVFQYIGSLESPSSIGLAGPDGTYLTLDLQREEVDFGEGAGSRLYADLPQGDPLKARADGLIVEWERQRWISHLGRRER